MLKAKLCLDRIRAKGNAATAVVAQEEYLKVETGREIIIGYESEEKY